MKFVLLITIPLTIFILAYPLIPEAAYYVYSKVPQKTYRLTTENSLNANTLIIPKIGIESTIIEGDNASALSKGSWHLPGTGNPNAGNMVIGGHRFAYLPPNNTTFYNLDKLKNGDSIYIWWNGRIYKYTVSGSMVVNPTDFSIENSTSTPTLTLFTCTPLWTSSMRLIVKAIPAKSFHPQ